MRRDQTGYGKIPQINLIPMLNVMMGILAFFVLISAMLSSEKGVDIALTGKDDPNQPATNEVLPDPLIVDLKPPDQILANGQPTIRNQLLEQIKTYLQTAPKGVVLLKADQNMQYEQVVDLLSDMQAVGGERVSLALEDTSGSAASATDPNATPVETGGEAGSTQLAPQPNRQESPSASESTSSSESPSPGVTIPEVPDDYDS